MQDQILHETPPPKQTTLDGVAAACGNYEMFVQLRSVDAVLTLCWRRVDARLRY